MIEKLYGNIPSYGKSYFTEKFDEIYSSMVKKSLDCTINVVDEYIKFWSDDEVQELTITSDELVYDGSTCTYCESCMDVCPKCAIIIYDE